MTRPVPAPGPNGEVMARVLELLAEVKQMNRDQQNRLHELEGWKKQHEEAQRDWQQRMVEWNLAAATLLDRVMERLAGIDASLERIDASLERIDASLDRLDASQHALAEKIAQIAVRTDHLDQRVDRLEKKP